MEHRHFGLRIGYLRWYKHLMDGKPPTMAEIGRAVSRESTTVTDWLGFENAPKDRDLDDALEKYFGVPATWIIRGAGEPPRPDLWKAWLQLRQPAAADNRPDYERLAEEHGLTAETDEVFREKTEHAKQKAAPKKQAANGSKKR